VEPENRSGPGRLGIVVILAGLFAISLGSQFVYLGQIDDNIFYRDPELDSRNYHLKALEILKGETADAGEVLTYNPLYPFILSELYGFMEEPDLHAVRVVQAVLGALNVVLLLVVGLRYFSFRTGALAAAAALLYAPLLFFNGELIQVSWVVFFLLAAFAILPLRPGGMALIGGLRTFVAGLFFGGAILGRPNLLPFLVVF
jgi:hypothetical protein